MISGQGNETPQRQTASGAATQHGALFDLLRRDHDRIRELFGTLTKSSPGQIELRNELLVALEQALLLHMEAEERFLYTALEQHETARGKTLESFEQHQVVRMVIGAFTGLAVDDERWPAKVKVLADLVRLHLEDEERELFGLAQQLLSADQLSAITAKVRDVQYDPKHTYTEKIGNSGRDQR